MPVDPHFEEGHTCSSDPATQATCERLHQIMKKKVNVAVDLNLGGVIFGLALVNDYWDGLQESTLYLVALVFWLWGMMRMYWEEPKEFKPGM